MNNGVPDDPWAKLNSQIARTNASWDELNVKLDEAIEKANNLKTSVNGFYLTEEDKKDLRLWPWLNSLSTTSVTIICAVFILLVWIVSFTIMAKSMLNISIHNMVQEDLNKQR
jgi:hypothetical protein